MKRSSLPYLRPTTLFAVLLLSTSCTIYTTRVDDSAGRPTIYNDPSTIGPVAGIGIESQDLLSMTDKMMRDMLTNPTLAGRQTPPRVIVDAEYFVNEGTSRLNKNVITDRLRIELNRAANGRMIFIGRHYSNMVEKERTLKREGIVDSGSVGMTRAAAGGDYRLGGRITTMDSVDTKTGLTSRFHQIVFEMVDLETGEIVWSGMYDFKKSAQDDIIYR